MFLAFSDYLSEFQYLSLTFHLGVADESGRFVFMYKLHPVARHLLGGLTRAVFLFLEVIVEAFHIDLKAFLLCHKVCQIDRETVCVEQLKCESTIDEFCALILLDIILETFDTQCQSAQE